MFQAEGVSFQVNAPCPQLVLKKIKNWDRAQNTVFSEETGAFFSQFRDTNLLV